MNVNALTDVQSPASAAELADMLGVEDTDTLLQPMLEAATDALEGYLNSAIVSRQFKAYFDRWPITGAVTTGLSGTLAHYDAYVELPYSRLISVDSVEAGGEPLTGFDTANTNPAKLYLSACSGDLTVTYTAGFDVVPSTIKTAVLYVAAFMYEHRGTCDADDALLRSGAAGLVSRYRIELGY